MIKISEKLIAKYINNEGSKEENKLIEHWLADNDKNRDEIAMARKIFEREEGNEFSPDIEKALNKVLDRLPEQKNIISTHKWNWLKIAALFILVVGSVYLTIRLTKSQHVELISYQQNIQDMTRLQLTDGSTIWIRKNGKVVYPLKFVGKERKIRFSGEAYFEIASDTKHPFVVEGEGIITRVLGTKFTLNTTSRDSVIYLVLEEGKVEFAPKGSGEKDFKKVAPGQKLSFNRRDKKIYIKENSDLNYLSWKTKSYKYQDKPIQMIIDDIEAYYNVYFDTMPESFSQETFSFEFDSLYTLDQVIENLEILTGISIEKDGDNYYFNLSS